MLYFKGVVIIRKFLEVFIVGIKVSKKQGRVEIVNEDTREIIPH